MHRALLTEDPLYLLRCLPTPEVRMDEEGVWQVERHTWFLATTERDLWLAFARTPTPSRSDGIAAFERLAEPPDGLIGFLGQPWSQVAASPTAVAQLQAIAAQVMAPDLARLLERLPLDQAQAVRDAVEADIDAGSPTAFTYLDFGV